MSARTHLLLRAAGWILGSLLVLGSGVILLWHLPQEAASQITDDDAKRIQVENATRATGAQIFLGLGIFIGLVLTYRRMRAIERQAETAMLQAETAARQADTAEDGQITERFTRAIEQLGTPEPERMAIRLGGIYSLERILVDSPEDAPTVIDVLAAFVRDESKRRLRPNEGAEPPFPLDTDLAAALVVLQRNRLPNQRVDLRGSNFAFTDLSHMKLVDFDFSDANLECARLADSNLAGSSFIRADLTQADLVNADLSNAKFSATKLVLTDLRAADLTGATFLTDQRSGIKLDDGVELDPQEVRDSSKS